MNAEKAPTSRLTATSANGPRSPPRRTSNPAPRPHMTARAIASEPTRATGGSPVTPLSESTSAWKPGRKPVTDRPAPAARSVVHR
jgi:hypothetical protein